MCWRCILIYARIISTVTGGSKGATVITGGKIQVPLFINEGDVLKIDTRDASYIERVSSKK